MYIILKNIKCNTTNFDKRVNCIINDLKINYNDIKKNLNLSNKRFKFIGINGNKPCKLNYRSLNKLENEIQRELKIKVSKDKHDLDFVFLKRTDGRMYLLVKLSYNRITEKTLEKWILRPEVSYLLSSLADIRETNIILDPLAGSGAISKEIIKYYKYNMIFAFELDETKYNKLKNEFKSNNKNFHIKNLDTLDFKFFNDNFIYVVITCPPWNIFEHKNENYTNFYVKCWKN